MAKCHPSSKKRSEKVPTKLNDYLRDKIKDSITNNILEFSKTLRSLLYVLEQKFVATLRERSALALWSTEVGV